VFLAQAVRRGVVVFQEKEAIIEDLNVVRVSPNFWSSFICISAHTSIQAVLQKAISILNSKFELY